MVASTVSPSELLRGLHKITAFITGLRMRLHSSSLQAVLLLALALPYCVNLGASSIWDASEAFYAETPREMLVSGDYWAPHFNFGPRTQKPPLTYWAILISYKIFGVNEFAVRVPSALAALGVIFFCYGMGRLLFNPAAALMAAIVTATTARVFILARRLPIDMLLLFFLTGTLFFLIWAIQTGKKRKWALAYLFASLGFLTKGPVALFIPGVSYVLWALWARRFKVRDTYLWMGVAIFMLVALPWYVVVYRSHGLTYVAPFFLRDNIGRFASETMGPSRGILYYFSVAAADFFPWSVLTLCALALLWTQRRSAQPLKSLEFGLPLFWCACTFLLFSLSKNKQEYYIAPIYPAASIILAGTLQISARFQSALKSWWLWAFGLMALFLLSLSLLVPFVFHAFMPNLSLVLHYLPSFFLLAGSLFLARSLLRRNLAHGFSALAVSLWTVFMLGAWIYLPRLEPYRPVKRFCRLIEVQREAEDTAGYFRTALPSMVFYLKQPIFEEYDVEGMKRRFLSGKRVFCILTERDYRYFSDNQDFNLYILDRHARFSIRFGALLNAGYSPGEELLLISNRPNSNASPSEDRSQS